VCGLEGVAHFSEHPGHKISDYGTTVDSVPDGFAMAETKDPIGRSEFSFSCIKCGILAVRMRAKV